MPHSLGLVGTLRKGGSRGEGTRSIKGTRSIRSSKLNYGGVVKHPAYAVDSLDVATNMLLEAHEPFLNPLLNPS